MFVFKMLIILKVLNNKLSSLQNRMKEKDAKIGDLMIWSAENLKTTNNQLMERLLKKAESVEK